MHDLIAIDTETSGLDPSRDFILSLGAVTGSGASFKRLILPPKTWLGFRKKVGAQAAKVNGFNLQSWKDMGAVEPDVAAVSFRMWLSVVKKEGAARPLAHNAGFDRDFLDAFSARTGIHFDLSHRWECSMAALSFVRRSGRLPRGACSLDALAHVAGLPRPAIHDALDDATVCLHGYRHLLTLAQ